MNTHKIGFIGMGKMGQAIANGLRSKNISFLYTDPIQEIAGIKPSSLADIYNSCSILVLCIKPQQFETLMTELSPLPTTISGIISVMAGISLSSLETYFGTDIQLSRVMPNTPATINMGISALAFNQASSDSFQTLVSDIFSSVGKTVFIDETAMDTVTALSGSGPAFFYRIVEIFSQAGLSLGLDYDTCVRLVSQTMLGAAAMIQASEKPISQLISDVCSPGGTTEAGIHQFDQQELDEGLSTIIQAAAKRSKELGKLS